VAKDETPDVSKERREGTSSWRLDVLHEADRIEEAFERGDTTGPAPEAVLHNLEIARKSASQHRPNWFTRFVAWVTGSDIERAWLALHAARQALFLSMPAEEVRSAIPPLRSKVVRYLDAKSSERKTYEEWLKDAEKKGEELDRTRIAAVRTAVDRASDLKYANVRRFRNTLLALLIGLLGLLAVLILDPLPETWLPVCGPSTTDTATPEAGGSPPADQASPAPPEEETLATEAEEATTTQSCPQVWHLAVIGAAGGLLATAAALRRMPATSEPYGLRRVQAALKTPTGALTAIIGTMLLQSDVIEALDPQPSPTILVYAVIFGYSQEAVTRFVDKRAKDLLTTGESTEEETT
jgi:hypothetical protein